MGLIRVTTSRFGEVEIDENTIYEFPEGILGFPGARRYFLLENPSGGPFLWLHAVDSPHLAFIVCDPLTFKPNYKVPVKSEDLENIQLTDIGKAVVLVILVVPEDPRKMTANLQGPVVLNVEMRLGKQLVITGAGAEYTTKYRVLSDTRESSRA
ncbi:MAG: flagellar assembly protein FliW [Planctomycetes bacterium]|nr:flagellar assembly protein FliW [Planctomycetota bacterium]